MIKIKNTVQEKLTSLRYKLFPVPQDKLFSSDVILHFSYHKCLTVYYLRVMKLLSKEFDFYYEHINGNLKELIDHLPTISNRSKWNNIINHPYFSEYVAQKKNEIPHNISYKDYLNTLDHETGIILELIFMQPALKRMQDWNFNNPNIIEKKYEDIIGNEVDYFKEMFLHYGFCSEMINRGLKIVEMYSLKNRPKTDKHIRKGSSNQWISEFSPLHKKLFKEVNGDLLITLSYEQDMSW